MRIKDAKKLGCTQAAVQDSPICEQQEFHHRHVGQEKKTCGQWKSSVQPTSF